MNRAFVAPLAALALVACNESGSVPAGNEEEGNMLLMAPEGSPPQTGGSSGGVGGGSGITPGMWETTSTGIELEMPNLPAEVAAEALRQTRAAPTVTKHCVTPEEAKAPGSALIVGSHSDCKYRAFSMQGGTLSSVVECPHPGGESVIAFKGSYTATTIDGTAEATITGAGAMRTKSEVRMRRLSDCS
jgi:hypothetical protein